MLKKYLVLSDDGALKVPPAYVTAESASEAIHRYCKEIQSKERFMREHIEDLKHLGGFAGTLLLGHLTSVRAVKKGVPNSVIHQKVMKFFDSRPDLGEQFLEYMEKRDVKVLSEALYEFVSERDTDDYYAIDEATVRLLD